MEKQVGVGMGVIIWKDGKILLGKRKGSHAAGSYAIPGGSMEYGEDFHDTAAREVMEETGMTLVGPVVNIGFTNDKFLDEGKHFVGLFVRATGFVGEPQNMEPHKCEGWGWYDPKELPQPLFPPMQAAINLWPEILEAPVNA
jgi:8-oxo-dGTP diphosphatase